MSPQCALSTLRFVMVRLHTDQQQDTSSHAATPHKPGSSTGCWSVSLSQWWSLHQPSRPLPAGEKAWRVFPLPRLLHRWVREVVVVLHPLNLGESTLLQQDAARSKGQQLVHCTALPKRHPEADTAKRRAGCLDILRHRNCFCLVCQAGMA